MGLLAFLFLSVLARAQVEDPLIARSFDHFYNLEYDEAIAGFTRAAAEKPDDANLRNHLAQAVLYRAMFRGGALESELVTGSNPFLRRPKMNPTPEEERLFEEAIRKSMEISQARLAQNPKDVQALYSLGVAYGLRANYNFLVRKAWRDSLRDATQARRQHNKVTELDRSMVDARLVQALHDYVVGSLPLTWKLLGFLIGFHGDREAGIRGLQLVARDGRLNKYDAAILLAAVLRRERRPKEALPLLEDLTRRFPRNYLLRLEQVQMFSDLGDKQGALNVLAEVERLKKAGAPGYARLPIEKVYYSRGNLLFWYNDLDGAAEELKKVAAKTDQLDLNTAMMAWFRLGQTYDLKKRRGEAVTAYRRAADLAPQSEVAKEARRYLESPYRRKG